MCVPGTCNAKICARLARLESMLLNARHFGTGESDQKLHYAIAEPHPIIEDFDLRARVLTVQHVAENLIF